MPDSEGMTKAERELIEYFLHLFSETEQELKRRLRLRTNDATSVSELIRRYRERNPFWHESAHQLWLLADVRNVLTHHRSTTHGYPVAVTRRSVTVLEQIKDHLVHPEPASARHRKKVLTVAHDDSLACVVALAFENGYSQFPVLKDGLFSGLITENEITRWLGRCAKLNHSEVDLATVSVRRILREKEPNREEIPIFRFAQLAAPIEEVIGLFAIRPMLEAVLLTETGNQKSPIEGIITEWDAARYSS